MMSEMFMNELKDQLEPVKESVNVLQEQLVRYWSIVIRVE